MNILNNPLILIDSELRFQLRSTVRDFMLKSNFIKEESNKSYFHAIMFGIVCRYIGSVVAVFIISLINKVIENEKISFERKYKLQAIVSYACCLAIISYGFYLALKKYLPVKSV